jgi:transposase
MALNPCPLTTAPPYERFDHPDQLSAYLGIVPSEHTTGQQRRLRSITKAGSTHARRLLVEAAHHYRRGRSSARRSSAANVGNHPRSSTSPGARNAG